MGLAKGMGNNKVHEQESEIHRSYFLLLHKQKVQFQMDGHQLSIQVKDNLGDVQVFHRDLQPNHGHEGHLGVVLHYHDLSNLCLLMDSHLNHAIVPVN